MPLKPGFHYPSWRPELTGDRFPLVVNTGRRACVSTSRVEGPSTRLVETGLQCWVMWHVWFGRWTRYQVCFWWLLKTSRTTSPATGRFTVLTDHTGLTMDTAVQLAEDRGAWRAVVSYYATHSQWCMLRRRRVLSSLFIVLHVEERFIIKSCQIQSNWVLLLKVWSETGYIVSLVYTRLNKKR